MNTNNKTSLAARPVVAIDPSIAGVAYVLNVGIGYQLTQEQAESWALILGGYEADVLRFAALEYTRQRRTAPQTAADISQIVGWLQRAIDDARPKYRYSERAKARDAFVDGFVAACGIDTKAFIKSKSGAPRGAPDTEDGDSERANLMQRIEKNRGHLARAITESDQPRINYFEAYVRHLEEQL